MLIAQSTPTTSGIADLVVALIPWALVFLFIWFFVFRMLRRHDAQTRRAQEHWRAVETKLDRLIEIAERRDKGG